MAVEPNGVPPEAYLVADKAFERDLGDEGDELFQALRAVSPIFRQDEITRHLPAIQTMASVEEVVRYLEGQRDLLKLFTSTI